MIRLQINQNQANLLCHNLFGNIITPLRLISQIKVRPRSLQRLSISLLSRDSSSLGVNDLPTIHETKSNIDNKFHGTELVWLEKLAPEFVWHETCAHDPRTKGVNADSLFPATWGDGAHEAEDVI